MKLYGDNYRLSFFLPHDNNNIRVEKSDTATTRFIPVAVSEVWLKQKPLYKLGEQIDVTVEFITVDYYIADRSILKSLG